MNQKKIMFVFFFSLLIFSLFSQTAQNLSYTVKGIVMDSVSLQSIPYATVSISAAATPKVYLKRLASGSNGDFELVLTKTGNYIISFESVGMKKLTQNLILTPEKKIINLGKINMSTATKNLAEVTVTALKPLIKVDLDKISYDVKSDPDAQSSTVLEMLKKVPLVTIDGEDKIQLKGSSDFKIYMNGKSSGMLTNNPSQVLKSIPASSIKSIEVITEPGAKYDAEGIGGIINIITDHSLKGLTGAVNGYTDTNGNYSGGIYLSTKTRRFGLTTNLNYSSHQYLNQIFTNEKENVNSLSTKYISQEGSSDSKSHFYFGNIEASYEFDSLNLVSFTLGGNVRNGISVLNEHTLTLNTGLDTLSAFKQLTQSQNGSGGIDMSLDYQRAFKKPEQLLTLSYKFSRTPNNTDNYSDLTGLLNYPNSNQHIQFNAKGDEHTFQADYTEPFNKIHVIEFGAKYILRLNTSVNNYLLQNESTLQWEPMPNQPKNNLDQTQNILGAYASYTLKLNKFSSRVGFRYEKTESDITLTDSSFHVSFQNLVPSVSIAYMITKSSSFRLSYNQRISRPSIWYLNPFIDNSNPFSIIQGNPDLNPEINNSFSLNYSYIKSKLNINANLYTSFTDNSIENVSKSLNDSVIYTTYKNIGINQSTGLSVYGNWQPDKFIRFTLNSSLGYSDISTNDGSGLNNKGTSYYLSLSGQFTLPHEIKLSMNGGYYSPRVMLQGQNSSYHYYGITLSREFLNKKLNFSVSARNPFEERTHFSNSTKTTDYKSNNSMSYVTRLLELYINYRFGELKSLIKKVEKTISNDDLKSGGGQNGGISQ